MKSSRKMPPIDVKKYGGKQVALLDGKIVATGATLSEVLARAQKAKPSQSLSEFKVFAVPRTLAVIYYASRPR